MSQALVVPSCIADYTQQVLRDNIVAFYFKPISLCIYLQQKLQLENKRSREKKMPYLGQVAYF